MKTLTHTVVVGGNFAGLTAALEIKRLGKENHRVTLISQTDEFLFIPSLIWVPFGRRNLEDITLNMRDMLAEHDIDFVLAKAITTNPKMKLVETDQGSFSFDHLVIATGPKVDFDVAPGVQEFAHYIGTPTGAMFTRQALEQLKENPGPVVIGASQNAGCMGAAYEFLFNFEQWLREQGIREQVELTWITPEDYLGHFGIDGIYGGKTMLQGFMKMFGIHYRTQSAIERMDKEHIYLADGTVLDYQFAMIMPPFKGVDFVQNSEHLRSNKNGYLPVRDTYQHQDYDYVWAAGIAVDVVPPFTPKKVPFSVPKTGFPADETGKMVAKNVVRYSQGKALKQKPWGKIPALCVMDAGKKEVIILGSSMFKPRWFAVMIPNVFYDIGKVMFEKYFLWKTKHGYSFLP